MYAEKKCKKFTGSGILKFLLFLILTRFCLFFFKKIRKNSIKLKKVNNLKFRFLWIFCIFSLHILAKFQDSSFTVAQVMLQNVILNKSQFCKKGAFFVRICPNLTKIFHLQDFFCDSIHDLYLCDNFSAFNVNINNFIGKNSEKSPKITPLFPI